MSGEGRERETGGTHASSRVSVCALTRTEERQARMRATGVEKRMMELRGRWARRGEEKVNV